MRCVGSSAMWPWGVGICEVCWVISNVAMGRWKFIRQTGGAPLHASLGHFPPTQVLVKHGAIIAIANKHGETPLSKARPRLRKKLEGEFQVAILNEQAVHTFLKSVALAEEFGQSLVIVPHKSEFHDSLSTTLIPSMSFH